MEKLQKNKQKRLYINKIQRLLLAFITIIFFNVKGITQEKEIYVNKFYKTVDSIIECKKLYNFNDTISFIQNALYSYSYNRVYYDFDSFFKCYDKNYVNKIEPSSSGIPTIEITSAYGRCDKKYILLFYIENYLLSNIPKKTQIPKDLNVYTPISLKDKKSGNFTIMGKENNQEQMKMIYEKLLKIYQNKKLIHKLLYLKKQSPLEYIGYEWDFEHTEEW